MASFLKDDGARNAGTVAKLDNSVTVRQLMRPLDPFLAPDDVTEIAINRPGEVWAATAQGWVRHEAAAVTKARLMSLANALAVYNNTALKPKLSVEFPDGQRCEITLPPACTEDQIGFSIRKHTLVTFPLEKLAGQGAFKQLRDVSFNMPATDEIEAMTHASDITRITADEAELLRLKQAGDWVQFFTAAVRCKRNIVIVGATGSGKTTLARSLVQKMPTTERIITIEDVHEMFLNEHPNHLHLLYDRDKTTGPESASGALRSCMRLKPDRILLSELRGEEAWVYLNSLNSGHPGSITTVHANSAVEGFSRIADLALFSPVAQMVGAPTVNKRVFTTINVLLFMAERKGLEVFYDPIFAKSKLAA